MVREVGCDGGEGVKVGEERGEKVRWEQGKGGRWERGGRGREVGSSEVNGLYIEQNLLECC